MTIESLKTMTRTTTPKDLRGSQRRHWVSLVTAVSRGELSRTPLQRMYEWACRHCGITVARSTFSIYLSKDVEALNAQRKTRRARSPRTRSQGSHQATRGRHR